MFIADYLRGREGDVWDRQDTAEVLRVIAEIEKTAQGVVDLNKAGNAEAAKLVERRLRRTEV